MAGAFGYCGLRRPREEEEDAAGEIQKQQPEKKKKMVFRIKIKPLEHPNSLSDPNCDLKVDEIQGVVDTKTIKEETQLVYRPEEIARLKEQQIQAKLEATRKKLKQDYQKTMPTRHSIVLDIADIPIEKSTTTTTTTRGGVKKWVSHPTYTKKKLQRI